MFSDELDYVVGVDSHRDRHAFALLAARTGAVAAECELSADSNGYAQALAFARQEGPGRRVWAVEGTGSYAAGLSRFLVGVGEQVLEVERPKRSGSRGRIKSDPLDAIRAARSLLAGDRLATPRSDGPRESLRALVATREGAVAAKRAALCQLRSLLIVVPDQLRSQLRPLGRQKLLQRCAQMRPQRSQQPNGQLIALRACARRILNLEHEADQLEHEIAALVRELAPTLLNEPGIGPINAAQLLISWSHHGRIRNEAAFARLAGTAPIPASSGKTTRHRLDRGGDRHLNRALHQIIVTRRRCDPTTITNIERRICPAS